MAPEPQIEPRDVSPREPSTWAAVGRGLFAAVLLSVTFLVVGHGIGRALNPGETRDPGIAAAYYHVPLP